MPLAISCNTGAPATVRLRLKARVQAFALRMDVEHARA